MSTKRIIHDYICYTGGHRRLATATRTEGFKTIHFSLQNTAEALSFECERSAIANLRSMLNEILEEWSE